MITTRVARDPPLTSLFIFPRGFFPRKHNAKEKRFMFAQILSGFADRKKIFPSPSSSAPLSSSSFYLQSRASPGYRLVEPSGHSAMLGWLRACVRDVTNERELLLALSWP
ncbi:uncharacterized protein V6R79_016454 [Siganus canaliculatus]